MLTEIVWARHENFHWSAWIVFLISETTQMWNVKNLQSLSADFIVSDWKKFPLFRGAEKKGKGGLVSGELCLMEKFVGFCSHGSILFIFKFPIFTPINSSHPAQQVPLFPAIP